MSNRPFSLLIKPASADCNLRCAYCFYLDRAALYPETARHRMSGEVLEKMVAGYLATDQPTYTFGWQGGEPTLMGVDFFRRATGLQQKYGRAGAVVANGLQTNAVLIDGEFAAHLARYNFLVGVSLDGPAEIHDAYRTTAGGRGSHRDVLRGIEHLRRAGVEFNALVLVSRANVGRAAEVYRYLRDQGILFHQYIPCVEFAPDGRPLPWTISGGEWGEFLCRLFDCWHERDTRTVSVRLFDSALAMLVDGVANVCHMAGNCCQYFVVEYNGDVYPCDFFVDEALKLGNIARDDWPAMAARETYLAFGRRKADTHARCRACPHRPLCAGDCPKHRLRPGGRPSDLSWLCAGWEAFYRHADGRLRALARQVEVERARRPAAGPAPGGPERRPGRNEFCPCGSGRKFKHCCGRD